MEEKNIVKAETGEMRDVKEMCFVSLSDAFDLHMRFVKGVVMLVSDCDHSAIACVLDEVETRLDYMQAIGDEAHNRLRQIEKEKAA
jgi:hypothetical protein